MDYLLTASGLLLLFIGGEALVRGSVQISKSLGISGVFIGMVVIGFGTSTPELLVSIQASLVGQPDIALGNVVGSNMANVLLILGIASLITPIHCHDKAIERSALAVVVSGLFLFGLAYVQVISQASGCMMLIILFAYLLFSYQCEQKATLEEPSVIMIDASHEPADQALQSNPTLAASLIMSIVGMVTLVLGADCLVEGASNLARNLGIPESVIGLSLVAIGTSLPELATAISAALKKNSEVIIGNVLGSNLFNTLSILGITAIIKPIPVTGQIATFDIPLSLGVAVISFLIIYFLHHFNRFTGFVFSLSYVAYIAWMYSPHQ